MVSNREKVVFSPAKVMLAEERIKKYLHGERIYPITIELDLSQRCTRSCLGCPYRSARQQGLSLQLSFLERLFTILGPRTPGLVISGGEPTLSPLFPETVSLARKTGFQEIAVITNGSCLDDDRVCDALLQGVTSVRVSLYDWQEGDSEYFLQTLRNIENLRKRADIENSPLEISAALLTRREWTHRLAHAGRAAFDSGIHWLYFHPFCVDWESRFPKQADQTGVLDIIAGLEKNSFRPEDIQVPYERYNSNPLIFSELHGSYFLIQVGADGINYAGPECKYDSHYALLDLNVYLKEDFLWHPQRLARIKAINSDNYSPIGTRHRPPIFSAYLQQFINHSPAIEAAVQAMPLSFRHPHII